MENEVIYGTAYYPEYLPYDRMETDFRMMKEAGINTIRIAESTWSTMEPMDGCFDFSIVCKCIETAATYQLNVIVGTPTYAIPSWLDQVDKSIITETETGTLKYGKRQNMDITNETFLFYAERMIRKLLSAVVNYKNVIGFQIDNETKHYHVTSKHVKKLFLDYLKETFHTVDHLNQEFGLAYWSNSIARWEDFPDITGTINPSLWGEFEKFRRSLVTKYLLWQRKIIDEYRRDDQFVTHNFDFDWKGYSYGVQPDVNHYEAANAVTKTGCDIYHKTQKDLTGKEISFCGSIARNLKKSNYLVLETQAQGLLSWTPYKNQLKLQAYTHFACGADGVMYWHWHSIHNACETYWKGILSHDLRPNRVYEELKETGKELQRIGNQIICKKHCEIAVVVSNESLTAISEERMFPIPDQQLVYNDIVRRYADALYELNLEYDVISVDQPFDDYKVLVIPVLYSATEDQLHKINDYIKQGGIAVISFKSGFSNEYLTVYDSLQPHILSDALGIYYQEYTKPNDVKIKFCDENVLWSTLDSKDEEINGWMELIQTTTAKTLASYDSLYWNQYSAITENKYGNGCGIYVGCHVSAHVVKSILRHAALLSNSSSIQLILNSKITYPLVVKLGINNLGQRVRYIMNYSENVYEIASPFSKSRELISNVNVETSQKLKIEPWEILILVEQ